MKVTHSTPTDSKCLIWQFMVIDRWDLLWEEERLGSGSLHCSGAQRVLHRARFRHSSQANLILFLSKISLAALSLPSQGQREMDFLHWRTPTFQQILRRCIFYKGFRLPRNCISIHSISLDWSLVLPQDPSVVGMDFVSKNIKHQSWVNTWAFARSCE